MTPVASPAALPLSLLSGPPAPVADIRTRAAAQEFEAVFIAQMMSHMFEGIESDPMFGGGPGEEMFRGIMVQEYGKLMAKRQGIGVSDQLQKMMIRMQEG